MRLTEPNQAYVQIWQGLHDGEKVTAEHARLVQVVAATIFHFLLINLIPSRFFQEPTGEAVHVGGQEVTEEDGNDGVGSRRAGHAVEPQAVGSLQHIRMAYIQVG